MPTRGWRKPRALEAGMVEAARNAKNPGAVQPPRFHVLRLFHRSAGAEIWLTRCAATGRGSRSISMRCSRRGFMSRRRNLRRIHLAGAHAGGHRKKRREQPERRSRSSEMRLTGLARRRLIAIRCGRSAGGARLQGFAEIHQTVGRGGYDHNPASASVTGDGGRGAAGVLCCT